MLEALLPLSDGPGANDSGSPSVTFPSSSGSAQPSSSPTRSEAGHSTGSSGKSLLSSRVRKVPDHRARHRPHHPYHLPEDLLRLPRIACAVNPCFQNHRQQHLQRRCTTEDHHRNDEQMFRDCRHRPGAHLLPLRPLKARRSSSGEPGGQEVADAVESHRSGDGLYEASAAT